MAWSSDEAYCYALDRLRELPKRTLVEILAEWEMRDRFGKNADHVWADEWSKAVIRIKVRFRKTIHRPSMSEHRMIGVIWNRATTQAGCDGDAWLCPYGCSAHCVPFGPEEGEECCLPTKEGSTSRQKSAA